MWNTRCYRHIYWYCSTQLKTIIICHKINNAYYVINSVWYCMCISCRKCKWIWKARITKKELTFCVAVEIWRSHSAPYNNMPLFLRLCTYPLQHRKLPPVLVFSASLWTSEVRIKVINYWQQFTAPIFRTFYWAQVPEEGSSKLFSDMKYWNKDKDTLLSDGMWFCVVWQIGDGTHWVAWAMAYTKLTLCILVHKPHKKLQGMWILLCLECNITWLGRLCKT